MLSWIWEREGHETSVKGNISLFFLSLRLLMLCVFMVFSQTRACRDF